MQSAIPSSARRLRILNIVHDERFGGPQSRILQVATRLTTVGVVTTVVMPRGDATFERLLRAVGINSHALALVRPRQSLNARDHVDYFANFWSNVLAIRRLIRDRRIDVVHTNGLLNVQGPIAARLAQTPLVWHLNDMSTPAILRRIIAPWVARWAEVIAISAQALAPYYFPNPQRLARKLQVLYAPVDTTRFQPVDRAAPPAHAPSDSDGATIGMMGNLAPGKGAEFFVEAAALIRQKYPKSRFLVVGAKLPNRQHYLDSLMARVDQLDLRDHLVFTGQRSDVPAVLGGLTLYVHPSEAEACPMAVLEACATGLPVVATDVGGTRELILDGRTGVLIRPRAPWAIAEAVCSLLAQPELMRSMGQAARARMCEHFSLQTCVCRHVEIYEHALAAANHGR